LTHWHAGTQTRQNSTQILRDFWEGTRLSDTCGMCKHTRRKW